MTRRVDRTSFEQALVAAIHKALDGLLATWLPYPAPRTASLHYMDALLGAVGPHVAAMLLEDTWRDAPPAAPREPGGTDLEDLRALAREVCEREVSRALAAAFRIEAAYERQADPSRAAADDEALRDLRATLAAELERRDAAERALREERAAEARARRAEKDAAKRATEHERQAREQQKREARKREREQRAQAKARAAGGEMPPSLRAAFAELGLPLDADRKAVDAAFRARLHAVHPDKHVAAGPAAQAEAHKRTIRAQSARERLVKWLESGGR